jgi:hypothetical protein
MTETVWIVPGHRSSAGVYHDRRRCPSLRQAVTVREVERETVPARRGCRECVGEVSHSEADWGAYQALCEAEASDA